MDSLFQDELDPALMRYLSEHVDLYSEEIQLAWGEAEDVYTLVLKALSQWLLEEKKIDITAVIFQETVTLHEED